MSAIAEPLSSALRPVSGSGALPAFADGWLVDGTSPAPYLDYLAGDTAFNWSEELEDLHENEGADHFLDTWTRRAVLDGMRIDAGNGRNIGDFGGADGDGHGSRRLAKQNARALGPGA